MSSLGAGVVMVALAVACGLFVVLGSPVAPLPAARRQVPGTTTQSGSLTSATDRLVAWTDRVLRARGWRPFPTEQLELAGLRVTQGSMLTTITGFTLAATVLAFVVGGLLLSAAAAVLVPLGARVFVFRRASKRRAAFVDQLDETMQMLASALRAGHSLPRAVETVSREAPSPTSDELRRVVNENRLGRDLVEALSGVAARMQSEDFGWVAQAVAVQRDTGGNLGEVLDRVGQTIRERKEIKELVMSLSAEGRLSVYVVMALPVFVAGGYSLLNHTYLAPLFTTPTGLFLLGLAVVLYAVGGLWMRRVTSLEV
ncbi:MAG: type II secretion system F family protein [Nocardioidaceae bacterium]|nr:type II secretion system F family protein [Nocardioidaceae bacterium]